VDGGEIRPGFKLAVVGKATTVNPQIFNKSYLAACALHPHLKYYDSWNEIRWLYVEPVYAK